MLAQSPLKTNILKINKNLLVYFLNPISNAGRPPVNVELHFFPFLLLVCFGSVSHFLYQFMCNHHRAKNEGRTGGGAVGRNGGREGRRKGGF